jgi:stage V sporulation protein SpoVS
MPQVLDGDLAGSGADLDVVPAFNLVVVDRVGRTTSPDPRIKPS